MTEALIQNTTEREPDSGTRPARSIRVVYNPNAGQKAGLSTNSSTLDELCALMEAHAPGCEVVATESEEDAIAATREAVARGYDVVAAAGGDGTVATVARELIGTRSALGVLPLGSVMNIARMLGLPRDLAGAAAIIGTGRRRSIDVGETGGHIFFEVGSVGLNAAVFREAQRLDDRDFRSIFTAVATLIRYRPARMVLHLDERVLTTRALMVTIANGPYTGIGFTVAPSARLDDGKFDVRVFRGFSRIGLVTHLARVAFGRHSYSPRIVTYRSSQVRIETRHPLPCRADSHDLGHTPVEFRVLPGAVNVIVPAE